MASKVLEVAIKGKDDGASQAFKQVGGAADEAGGKLAKFARQQQMQARRSGENALARDLKSPDGLANFGLQSAGIAIPGLILDQVGQGLAKATSKILEMNKALRDGSANAADISLNVLKALPIIGGFAEAGANINEMFTHTKQETEENNRAMEQGVEFVKREAEGHSKVLEILKSETREYSNILDQARLIGVEGYERQSAEAAIAAKKEMQSLDDKQKAEIDGIDKANKAELDGYRAQRIAAEKAFDVKGITDAAQRIADIEKRQAADRLKIIAQQAAETAVLNNKVQAEESDRSLKSYNSGLAVLRKYNADTKKITDLSNLEILKSNGDTYKADLLQVDQNAAEKKAANKEHLEDSLKNLAPELRGRAAQDAADRDTAIDAEAAAKRADIEREHGEQVKSARQTIAEQMLEMEIDVAKQAADNETDVDKKATADKLVARLEAEKQYQSQSAEVARIQNDKNATEAERTAAASLLKILGQQKTQAGNGVDVSNIHKLAWDSGMSVTSQWDTGLAEAAKERADGEYGLAVAAAKGDDDGKGTDKTNKLLADILLALTGQNNQPVQILAPLPR